MAHWLAEVEIQLHAGGFIELTFAVNEATEHTATRLAISGVVVRCVPPDSLAFIWTDTIVISKVMFELERRSSQVMLLLTHAGLPMTQTAAFCASWHSRLDILRALLCNAQCEVIAVGSGHLISHYEQQRDARTMRNMGAKG